MPIQSVKSFVVADNDKFEAKQELDELYKIKNSLVLDIEKYKEDKKLVEDLTKQIDKLALKKTTLDFEVFSFKSDHKVYSESLKELKGDVALLEETRTNLLSDIIKLNKELENVSNNYKFELNKTSTEINLKNKEIQSLDKLINIKTDSLSKLEEETSILSSSNIDIKNYNIELLKKRNELVNQNSELTTKVLLKEKVLNEVKNETETELGRQSKIISDFKSNFSIKKMEANDAIEKMYKDKEKEITNKQGVISEKESWLMKREQKLKEIKTDLEVFYNKKIDNIIF